MVLSECIIRGKDAYCMISVKAVFVDYSHGFIHFVYLNNIIEDQRIIRGAIISINPQFLKIKKK